MTYEYVCKNCGHKVTLVRSIEKRNEPVYCCKCGSKMTRKFGEPVITVKGRGTYTVSFPKYWLKEDDDELERSFPKGK